MSNPTLLATDEANRRREAVRRYLQGESPITIAHDLGRSRQWVYACWWRYQADPHTDCEAQSRAPQHWPQQTPPEVEHLIVTLRQPLEAGASDETRSALIGAGEIRTRLDELRVEPLPCEATIQRVLAKHDLTQLDACRGARPRERLLPVPVGLDRRCAARQRQCGAPPAGHPPGVQLPPPRWVDPSCGDNQALDNASRTAGAHRLQSWEMLGIPALQQLDHAAAWCGGQTHPRVLGKVVRWCLCCGIELFFIPLHEAQRNHWVEHFHEVWEQAFWSRTRFTSLAHQQREQPQFEHWYVQRYRPPALEGATMAQFTADMTFHTLTPAVAARIPDYTAPRQRLPLTAGYLHVMRKVKADGTVELLNDVWAIGRRWVGEYVRATIDLAQGQIAFWYPADAELRPRVLLTRVFRPQEPIHDVQPPFRHNCQRCRDCLPV